MTPAALQRQAALVGAALLAILLVVVLDRPGDEPSAATPPPVAQPEWETAVIWVTPPDSGACSQVGQDASGVVHPVLLSSLALQTGTRMFFSTPPLSDDAIAS